MSEHELVEELKPIEEDKIIEEHVTTENETEITGNEETQENINEMSDHQEEVSEQGQREDLLENTDEGGLTDEEQLGLEVDEVEEHSVERHPPEESLILTDAELEQHDGIFPVPEEKQPSMADVELAEMPRDDDVTAEELELNEPLDQWVSELVPDMRDLIAPQFFSTEEPLDLPEHDHLDEEPCLLPQVLISESPMMVRFQATLRAHLIRQKEKLESDIYDMELACNKKNNEIRDLGLTINKEQEHLNKQRDLINKYRTGIEEVLNKRKQFDNANSKKSDEFKETRNTFTETEKEDKTLFHQCEEMNELAFRLGEMEKIQNDELKFAKNLSEKQRNDRLKLAQEKQKQDLYIWKLNSELERLGLETQVLIEQTELKKKEVSELSVLVTDIEADSEALRKENAMIICATQQLVQEIKTRDKGFKEAEEKVGKAQSELSLVLMRIRSYNKSLRLELERKFKLNSSKNSLEIAVQRLQILSSTLNVRREEAMDKLAYVQNMIETLEAEQKSKSLQQSDLTTKHKTIVTDLDELKIKRLELKNRYMRIMSEMKIQSAVTRKLQKSMEDLSHENQDISLRKLEVDCKIGELMTDIEHSKVKRVQLDVRIDNIKNAINDKESVLNSLEVHKKKIHHQIESYKSKVIGSRKRLENLIKFNDDSEGQSQLVRRVNFLETELISLDTKINEVKQTWMDTQNSLIENTYKLSQLESTTNTVRKHLFLTKYKREKLDSKMNQLDLEKKKAEKQFSWFHNKLTSMTLENYRHEQAKDKLADMAKETETKFVTVLKEAEETAVLLSDEICCLEEVNCDMSDEIERLQREFLAWEKKWKMAVEARERVERERASTGEIGAMKLEIHRMEVRYSQLKKAQEKLSQDLELCISRRDNIMDLALAKEKRSTSAARASYTREQFNKKLDTIRQKTKQLKVAMKSAEKEIQELEVRREELMNDFMRKQKQLCEVKLGVDKLETEIQEGQLHKYKSLEMVVRRQRKIRLLDEVKHNRYRLFCKNESNISHEGDRQELVNCNLVEVVQSLLGDFPKLKLQLIQIYNTLMSPPD